MTKIYFPELKAMATVDVELKRGGRAEVCDAFDGYAYFGKIHRNVKFTTVEPKTRAWKESDIDVLHATPAGIYCYGIMELNNED